MGDPFDSVFGSERGIGLPAQPEQTPLSVARKLVADLNAPGEDTVVKWGAVFDVGYVDGLIIAAAKRGLTLLPPYGLEFDRDHVGFCFPVAATPEGLPFAVLRLNDTRGEGYAELWRLDPGEPSGS